LTKINLKIKNKNIISIYFKTKKYFKK